MKEDKVYMQTILEKEKKFINNQLNFICKKLLDENIDFYIVGALGGYIDADIEILRKHDDIDVLINENDINLLNNIFIDTDYRFIDNRFQTENILNIHGFPEGEKHDLYALYKDDTFHIGFFTYRKNLDSYSFVDYFKQKEIVKRLIRTIPLSFFDYQYNNETKLYNGLRIKTVRKELIYKNKLVMNREKDFFDIKVLEPYIDRNILNKLSKIKDFRTISIENVNKLILK